VTEFILAHKYIVLTLFT